MSDEASERPYRLFVGVPVPGHVKDEIERAQQELRRALSTDRLRWAGRAQLHVTLKFLGAVDPARVEPLTQALEAAVTRIDPVRLEAVGVVAFPERRARMLWVRVRDTAEHLALLHRAVEESTADFTSEAPERGFTAHITLARFRSHRRRPIEPAQAFSRTMESRHFGSWIADAVEVVRSEPGPSGPRYTTLAAIPLSGRSRPSPIS